MSKCITRRPPYQVLESRSQADAYTQTLLYDYQDICCAVSRRDRPKVMAHFGARVERLSQIWGDDPAAADAFLASLNQSLFDYFLFARGVSLLHCRHQNRRLTRAFDSVEELYRRGEALLDSYLDALEEGNAHKAKIHRATTFIDANLAENISLDDVCGWACVSRCQFCQLFKACTGCTFSEYLMGRRVERAKRLLVETSLPSQDIARLCGFSSASYFTTVSASRPACPRPGTGRSTGPRASF